MTPNF